MKKIINYIKMIDNKYDTDFIKYLKFVLKPVLALREKYNYLVGEYIYKNNSIQFQKKNWEKYSLDAINGKEKWGWGDPDNPDDSLGNYLQIKNILENKVINKIVIDLGSLTGKWTPYMLKAKKIWCVDLNEKGFIYIKQNYNKSNINFYKTRGDELDAFEDFSIDFIFSMDSLVRAPKKSIEKYFFEIHRVLSWGGEAMIHLPCTCSKVSNRKGFTKLKLNEIIKFSKNANLTLLIDFTTINHGIICFLKKEENV